jgi:hypothetical protein
MKQPNLNANRLQAIDRRTGSASLEGHSRLPRERVWRMNAAWRVSAAWF